MEYNGMNVVTPAGVRAIEDGTIAGMRRPSLVTSANIGGAFRSPS